MDNVKLDNDVLELSAVSCTGVLELLSTGQCYTEPFELFRAQDYY